MENERFYLKSHEWIEFTDEGTARIGISDYAQNEMGDIVFVNLPEIGDELKIEESFAEIESVKSIADVYSPVDGLVIAINQDLIDSPELINEEAYEAWLVEVGNISARDDLMDEDAYEEFLEGEK